MLASRWPALPLSALVVVAPPPAGRAPTSAALPTITVPRLDSNGARIAFTVFAEIQCKGRLRVGTERVAGAPPVGTWVRQTPNPGATIACDGRVTVDLSDGSIGAPAPVALPAPTPVPLPSPPALPSAWRMPDITLAARLADLQRDAVRRCRALLRYEDKFEASEQRQGTVLGQDPAIGTPIGCATRIALIRASALPPVVIAPSAAGTVRPPTAVVPSAPAGASGASDDLSPVPAETSNRDDPDVSTWLASSQMRWLAAAVVVVLALSALIARARHGRPRPPVPWLEAGTAIASAAPASGGPGAALPLIALETGTATSALAFPDGIPVEAVETGNG